MSDKVYKGKCFCESVHIEAKGEPIFRSLCHCTICQRMTGAECSSIVGFPGHDTLNVVQGEELLTKMATSEVVDRFFCSKCGSSVYNICKMEEYKFKDAPTVIMDDYDAVAPQMHIFYGRRRRDYNDDFPKFVEFPSPGAPMLTNDGKPLEEKKE